MHATRTAGAEQQNKQFYDKLAQDRELGNQRINATLAGIAARGAGRDSMTSGQEFNAIDKLNFRYMQNTKLSREMGEQSARMNTAMQGIKAGTVGLNEGSQAIINGFNRMLEPGSVTRESEYARTPEGQALINSILGRAEAITKGGPGVRPQELEGFVTLANTFMERANKNAAAEKARVEAYAKRFNLPMELVVAEYGPGGAVAAKKKFEILSVK
jgi:hypothetical protein